MLKEITPEENGARINLNRATSQQLCSVPGIGPKTAQRIINYRTQNGYFNNISELQNVPRIGPKTFINIKNYFYIDASSEKETSSRNKTTFIDTRQATQQIDTSQTCPHCNKQLYEEGKKKKVHIRCPQCLNLLNE